MAKPQTREDLKEYCLRKLGHPVLEINVSDEQVDDAIDDALQVFHERHFDGVERMYLKYRVTKADIDRGKAYGYNDTSMNSTGHGHGVISSGISTYIFPLLSMEPELRLAMTTLIFPFSISLEVTITSSCNCAKLAEKILTMSGS